MVVGQGGTENPAKVTDTAFWTRCKCAAPAAAAVLGLESIGVALTAMARFVSIDDDGPPTIEDSARPAAMLLGAIILFLCSRLVARRSLATVGVVQRTMVRSAGLAHFVGGGALTWITLNDPVDATSNAITLLLATVIIGTGLVALTLPRSPVQGEDQDAPADAADGVNRTATGSAGKATETRSIATNNTVSDPVTDDLVSFR